MSRTESALSPVLRRLGLARQRAEQPNPRASSFPFVSGDTFRAIGEVLLELSETTHRPTLRTGVIFCEARLLSRADIVDSLRGAKTLLAVPSRARVVIHNGDNIAPLPLLRWIRDEIGPVFATNIVDEETGITAIPIGLENVSLKHNGKLHYYLVELDRPTPLEHRTRLVLSSFHTSTNPTIRDVVRQQVVSSGHSHEDSFRKSLEYREQVRRSMFVISPPGNGPDCHRTWEAMYLGAVPVVLSSHLAGSLRAELPIHAVDDYTEFLSLSQKELTALYILTRQKSTERAFAMYWLSQVLEA